MTGQMVGKYKVEDRVGRGGMGTVYRAVDETLQREVALKVLNAELNDPEVARRFRAEAVTVARLSHPGIATIYELFQNDGQWLMVMEFVRGETLERLVTRSGALPVPRVAELCMQALAALAHAHALGVVHRDLKPANLMINEIGVVKVMDFGIARVSGSEHLTNAGFMMGTPAYMAPEQVMGAEVDARADLYAMGVVFYRLVTGKLPFKGDTAFAMAQSQVNDPPTPVMTARPDLPPWVEPIITRALSKSPQDRFQSAAEFHEALARSVAGMPMAEHDLDGSAPTELMSTPTRTPLGMPTPYAGPTTASPTPAGYAPSTKPPAPVATGGTKQPTGGTKQPTAAARITAKVAAITKNKKMTTPMIAGAAALVVIVVLGIWMATRNSAPAPAPPPAAPPVVADATPTPPATPPDASAAAPPATDAAAGAAPPPAAAAPPDQPPTPPPTQPPPTQAKAQNPPQVPPAGRSSGTAAGKGDKAGAPAGSRGTASGAPTVPPPQQQQPPISTVKPAAETAPPTAPPAAGAPAANDPLAAFGNIKLLEVNGRRSTDRDVVINFGGGHILVLPRDGGTALATLQYKQIRKATYFVGRDPKWDPSLAAPPADLDVGSILRQSRHWLVVQTADTFAILRLEERSAAKFVQTLEERAGIKADRPVQGK